MNRSDPGDDTWARSSYTTRQLAEAAGTTVRTIHYYTAEGLLPPPAGSTRGATYSQAHLARLRIIAVLRDEGLALGKIRERLAPLTDEQALHLAAMLDQHLASHPPSAPLNALSIVDLELARQTLPADVSESFLQAPAAYDIATSAFSLSDATNEPTGSAREYLDRLLRRAERGPAQRRGGPQRAPSPANQYPAEPPEVWYQFRLGDGVELRLREDRYREAKGRPAALIEIVRANLLRYGVLPDTRDVDDDDEDR